MLMLTLSNKRLPSPLNQPTFTALAESPGQTTGVSLSMVKSNASQLALSRTCLSQEIPKNNWPRLLA